MELVPQAPQRNVVALMPKGEVEHNSQAVEYLTGLLEQAQAGELTEFNMVYKVKGEYANCWTGCSNLIELQGMLTRITHLTNLRMDLQQ